MWTVVIKRFQIYGFHLNQSQRHKTKATLNSGEVLQQKGNKEMDKGIVSGETNNETNKTLPLQQDSSQGRVLRATNDENLTEVFRRIKTSKTPVVVKYGATWCRVCNQMLPAFFQLSNKFPKLSFVYADVDECPETTKHIRFTPTFHFYRDGERVDEMFGAGEERLHDRLWLHS